MSSVAHRGVTTTYTAAQMIGAFADGSPCVVAPLGLTISDVQPASAVVNSYQAHGLMRDPAMLADQGWDGMIAVNGTSTTAQALTPYNAAKNLDPAVSGPLVIAPGSRTSLVKSIRKSGATTSDFQIVGAYSVVTVLDTVPPAGAFRPGMADPLKTIYGRIADLDFSVLRNEPAVAGAPSIATILAGNYLQPCEPAIGYPASGEKLRRFSLEASGASAGNPNYSGQYGVTRADILTALHTDASNADKLPLLILAVQYGIDLAGMIAAGDYGGSGAGQWYGQLPFLYLAGFALKSQALLDKAAVMRASSLNQLSWITSDQVGQSVYFPASTALTNRNHQTFLPEQVGQPAWSTNSINPAPLGAGSNNPQADNSQAGARYETQARTIQPIEILNVGLLRNGPGGVRGDQLLVARNSAAVAWMDRTIAETPSNYGGTAIAARHLAAYNARRSLLTAQAKYEGKPFLFNQGGLSSVSANDRLTAGSGQFAWDLSDVVFGNPAPTQVDMRYGTDGVSWVEETNVGFTGTKTGLPSGKLLYVQFALVNSYGRGAWSINYAFDTGTSERFTATPTGTPSAAAPANVLAPAIAYNDLPSWLGPHYAMASGTLPANVAVIYAGDGFWSGYPYPTITYQWQIDSGGWTDLAGETSKALYLSGNMKGSQVRCNVTATNATSPAVTLATPAVTVSAAAATQAFYTPIGALDALPRKMTQRWAGTPAITLLRKTVTSRPAMQVSANATGANRFWSLDDVMPIGDLASVADGEMFVQYRGTSTGSNAGPQIVIRGAGDETTASGYIVQFATGTTVRFVVYRVSGGTRTTVMTGTLRALADWGLALNSVDTGIRVRWQTASGQLQIQMRAWGMPDASDTGGGDTEPATWWETYTDTSPLPAGRLGIGSISNAAIHNIYGVGLAVGSGTAPKVPV